MPAVDVDSSVPAVVEEDKELLARMAWVQTMRLAFCRRPDFPETHTMVADDGSLIQEYFMPKRGQRKEEALKWTAKERQLLIQGIETIGIGNFRKISETLLPDWSPNDLRLKTIRLIGRQNLQLYKDWRGNEEAIQREFLLNKEIGTEFGTWKGNVLVYDDAGLVLKRLIQLQKESAATNAIFNGGELADASSPSNHSLDADTEVTDQKSKRIRR